MRASGAKRRRGLVSIVVDAFLAASRDGDFDALLAVLERSESWWPPRGRLFTALGFTITGGKIVVRGSILA